MLHIIACKFDSVENNRCRHDRFTQPKKPYTDQINIIIYFIYICEKLKEFVTFGIEDVFADYRAVNLKESEQKYREILFTT